MVYWMTELSTIIYLHSDFSFANVVYALTSSIYLSQIILTHEHADAILGLDDVRVVQPFSPTNDIDPTPIYLSQYAMDRYFSSC
jgi:phosphoribosyl 1,2-cyclic phosphodiesterase